MTPSLASILVATPIAGSFGDGSPGAGSKRGVSGIEGVSSSDGTGVDGTTTVGARFGSLCEDSEGTKRASHAALESSESTWTLLSSLISITE